MSGSTPVKQRIAPLTWLVALAFLCFDRTSDAASCISDAPPNDQPATGQIVPAEFCVAGAAGQHYYLWSIPDSLAGRQFVVKLQSLPGETSILVVQSLDADPRKGPFHFTTQWQGKSTAANSNLETPSLMLKPGLYGIAAATAESPGLFRLSAVVDTTLAASSISSPAATQTTTTTTTTTTAPPAPSAAPSVAAPPVSLAPAQSASPPVLDRKSVAVAAETIVPWTIDAAGANTRWTVVLQTTAGSGPRLALMGPDGKDMTLDSGGADKAGILHYPELGLAAGAYKFRIQAKEGSPLSLRVYAIGPRDAGHVTSPNATLADAFIFKAGASLSGVIPEKGGSTAQQYVALVVDETWKNKKMDLVLRATPTDRSERLSLSYVSPQGGDFGSRSGSGQVRFSNLSLDPGKYLFRISAGVSDDLPYTLAIENISPQVPGEEREPNDVAALATLIPPDGTISGQSDGDSDYDFFRFHTDGAPQLWTISCDGKGVDWLTLLGADGEGLIQINQFPNDHAQMSGVLLAAGDHLIRLRSTGSHYVLKVTRQSAAPVEAGGHPAAYDAPTTISDEIEPNDDPARALPIALDSSRGGLNDRNGDQDYYRFTLLGYTHIRLTLDDAGQGHRKALLSWGSDQRPIATLASGAEQRTPFWDGVLAAGDYYVMVKSDDIDASIYRLRLASRDPFESKVPAAAPAVHADLSLAPTQIAAFSPRAQSVNGKIDIVSQASAAMDLTIIPYVADDRWHATVNTSKLHLEPGASATVTMAIQVAPQAWADHAVLVGIGLRDATGGHVAALTTLSPALGAPEANATPVADIPPALVGGINVAWSALGGQSRDAHPELIDGLLTEGGSLKLKKADSAQRLTVALGGSGTTKLKGFALVPAGSVPTGDRLRHFRISGSTDGAQFSPLFSGELSSRTDPQYFVLDKPVDAHFVALEMLDAHDPNAATIAVAEFMAISDPQNPPAITLPTEISSLLLGGHVLWMDPHPFATTLSDLDAQSMLSSSAKRVLGVGFPAGNTTPLSWAIGFLDDRAARVDSLEWSYPGDENPNNAIPSVQLFGSTAGPRGPWTALGTWKISPQGASTPFKLGGQPSLRFIKFVAAASKTGYSEDLPLHVAVRAAVVANERPIFALATSVATEIPSLAAQSADKRLALGGSVAGFVRLDTRTDHWAFDNTQGPRSIVFTLANKPSMNATLAVKNQSGKAVPLTENSPSPDIRQFKGELPAGTYTVDVSEPPISIALVWDTSDSVRDWLPSIIAAVRSVAQDASPGRVEFNLFPFRDPTTQPLLKDFTGDAATLFSALQSYDWKDNSSSAETALIGANDALKARPGRRAILLLTDAETSSLAQTGPLWNSLDQTGAQIFALAVPTKTTGEMAWRSHNLMMDWAITSGGFLQMVGDQGALEASFKRAVAATRTGSAYTLSAAALAPQGPGTLTVSLAPPTKSAHASTTAPSVALVLDASGSMLQKIKGRQKIEIARAELDHLVRDVLPESTPVTLRVYGQGGKGSCTSDLMMPLAPLDRQRAEQIVAGVKSTNGAKTATSASLHATAQDLSAAHGAKRIILITDGEENCGGDVEKEITELRRSGFDLQLSIIGFAIDSPQVGVMFKHWAQLGGGSYYETHDAPTLDAAMTSAIRPQFDVVDDAGKTVTTGAIGSAPITLPAGHYAVRLHGSTDPGTPIDIQAGKNAPVILTQ
jgi:hypothetical protein